MFSFKILLWLIKTKDKEEQSPQHLERKFPQMTLPEFGWEQGKGVIFTVGVCGLKFSVCSDKCSDEVCFVL